MPAQPIAVALVSYDGTIRHGSATHENGYSNDTFVADYSDFGRSAILRDVKLGYDGCRGEINVTQLLPRFVKDFAERHRNQFQLGKKALVFICGQGVKKMVLSGCIQVSHKISPDLSVTIE
jgi:hypothetical protein